MIEDIYDIEIDIKTFEDLKNNGWEIKMSEEGLEKYQYFSDEKNKVEENKLTRIGILGGGKVGKTFILHKLLNKDYDKKIKTKGISFIYPEINSENKIVYLDTCNTLNTSLYNKNKNSEELYNLNDSKTLNYINELKKEQKFRNIFIEDFIIEKTNIVIIVLNDLTFKEQKFLNRLKHKNFNIMFVIHNLKFFCDIKSIEDYIENVIKQSVFSNLKKKFIPKFLNSEKKDGEKAYYYIEKRFGFEDNNENSKQNIIHLFMGKEGSVAGKFFNDQSIVHMKYLILSESNTKFFDVLKEIKEFLSFSSILYMINEDNKERPIEEDEFEIDKYDDCIYLKCKNKNFKLKNSIINEMGNTSNTNNSINPPFECYKGIYEKKKKNEICEIWPALIVKAEMFVDAEDIEISQAISDDHETMNITISCKKKFEGKDPNIIDVNEYIDGNIKEGNMKINIKVNLNEIILDDSKRPQVREPFPGIKLIYFKINEFNREEINKIIIKPKKKINK